MLIATLGWLGTTGTFGAYILLSRGWLASQSLTYSVLNAVGGVLAGAASAAYGAWPSVVSNLVWAAVGLHAAGRTLMDRRGESSGSSDDRGSDLLEDSYRAGVRPVGAGPVRDHVGEPQLVGPSGHLLEDVAAGERELR